MDSNARDLMMMGRWFDLSDSRVSKLNSVHHIDQRLVDDVESNSIGLAKRLLTRCFPGPKSLSLMFLATDDFLHLSSSNW